MVVEVVMQRWMLVVGLMGVVAACADGGSDDAATDLTTRPETTAAAGASTQLDNGDHSDGDVAGCGARLGAVGVGGRGHPGWDGEGGRGWSRVGCGWGRWLGGATTTRRYGRRRMEFCGSAFAHDEAVFGGPDDQVVRDLVAGGPGFVATGFDESSGDRDAAVWTSVDGLEWTRVVDHDGALGGPGDQDATGVIAGDELMVAVGYDQSETVDQDVAVWTSRDGLAWTRVPHDEGVFGGEGNQATGAVGWSASGFVAVGYDVEVAGAGPDFDAAVWVSPDGASWARVPHDEPVFGGDGWQGMETVLAGPAGIVALGYSDHDDNGYDVAVWTSTDGSDWVRVPHDDDVFGGVGEQLVRDVAALDVGLVAVGRDAASGDDDAAVWISADGADWTQLQDESFGGPGEQEMRGTTVFDDDVIAVGTDRLTGEPAAVVWVGRPESTAGFDDDLDAADEPADDATPTPEDSQSDLAAAEAAERHRERATQFDALLAEQGLIGLVLDDGAFLGPKDEFNTIETLEVPLENDVLRGRVIFEELSPDAGGEWAMVMFVEEILDETEGAAWVDGAIQSLVRMLEPALPDAEIADLAADLTATGDYNEAVGGSIFITHGGITDLPLDVIAAEAMDFTYSDRYEGIAPTAFDPSAITLTPVEWAMPSPDWGAAIIVEVSEIAPWDVEDIGARLIWDEMTVTLCNDRLRPAECTLGPYMRIRKAGDGYLHVGDALAFDERPRTGASRCRLRTSHLRLHLRDRSRDVPRVLRALDAGRRLKSPSHLLRTRPPITRTRYPAKPRARPTRVSRRRPLAGATASLGRWQMSRDRTLLPIGCGGYSTG